jgi:hypothetical protein
MQSSYTQHKLRRKEVDENRDGKSLADAVAVAARGHMTEKTGFAHSEQVYKVIRV